MEVDIFGSCVTRDAFALQSDIRVKSYYSRSSFLSVIDKKRKLDEEINLEHNFLKRSIIQDLNKTFFNYSKKPKPRVIVIDLIQERYSLNYLEGSYSTYSPDYRRAKLPVGKLISGPEQFDMFRKNINRISSLLSNYDLVILHEANLVKGYFNSKNEYETIDLSKGDNYFLEYGERYYKLLKESLPRVETIKIDGYNADPNHKWGISPSHYEQGYYLEFINEINKILSRYF